MYYILHVAVCDFPSFSTADSASVTVAAGICSFSFFICSFSFFLICIFSLLFFLLIKTRRILNRYKKTQSPMKLCGRAGVFPLSTQRTATESSTLRPEMWRFDLHNKILDVTVFTVMMSSD